MGLPVLFFLLTVSQVLLISRAYLSPADIHNVKCQCGFVKAKHAPFPLSSLILSSTHTQPRQGREWSPVMLFPPAVRTQPGGRTGDVQVGEYTWHREAQASHKAPPRGFIVSENCRGSGGVGDSSVEVSASCTGSASDAAFENLSPVLGWSVCAEAARVTYVPARERSLGLL